MEPEPGNDTLSFTPPFRSLIKDIDNVQKFYYVEALISLKSQTKQVEEEIRLYEEKIHRMQALLSQLHQRLITLQKELKHHIQGDEISINGLGSKDGEV